MDTLPHSLPTWFTDNITWIIGLLTILSIVGFTYLLKHLNQRQSNKRITPDSSLMRSIQLGFLLDTYKKMLTERLSIISGELKKAKENTVTPLPENTNGVTRHYVEEYQRLQLLLQKKIATASSDYPAHIAQLAKQALRLNLIQGKNAKILVKKINHAFQHGDFNTAFSTLKRLEKTTLSPVSHAETLFQLAMVSEQFQHDYQTALNYIIKANKVRPNNREYLLKYADLSRVLGLHKQALTTYTQVLEIDKKTDGRKHKGQASTADLWTSLGLVHFDLADHPQAMNCFEKALNIKLTVYGEGHPSTASTWHHLGKTCHGQQFYEQAINFYKKSLCIDTFNTGQKITETATLYDDLAQSYYKNKDYEEAIFFYHKALNAYMILYGEKHQETAKIWHFLGNTYSYKGDYHHALEYHKKVLKLQLELHGKQHATTISTWCKIAQVYHKQQNFDQAINYYQQALAMDLVLNGDMHHDTANTLYQLACVYLDKQHPAEAMEHAQKSLNVRLALLGDKHLDTGLTLHQLGKIYSELKDYEQAINHYKKALSIYLNLYGEKHASTEDTWSQLSFAYKMQAQKDKTPLPLPFTLPNLTNKDKDKDKDKMSVTQDSENNVDTSHS